MDLYLGRSERGSGPVTAVAELPGPGQPRLIVDFLEAMIVDVGTLARRDALLDPRPEVEPPD